MEVRCIFVSYGKYLPMEKPYYVNSSAYAVVNNSLKLLVGLWDCLTGWKIIMLSAKSMYFPPFLLVVPGQQNPGSSGKPPAFISLVSLVTLFRFPCYPQASFSLLFSYFLFLSPQKAYMKSPSLVSTGWLCPIMGSVWSGVWGVAE